MKTSFYSQDELTSFGFKHLGQNVKLSRNCSVYGAANISIDDNSRIDDFCLLSGHITIGKNVHIASHCAIFAGTSGVVMEDFAGLSSRIAIYAESDDYSGEFLTNPTIPDIYKKTDGQTVILRKHSIIGTGCTIMPGVIIGEGTAVGSMSLITKSLDPWGIYVGIPCKRIKERSQRLLDLEAQFLSAN